MCKLGWTINSHDPIILVQISYQHIGSISELQMNALTYVGEFLMSAQLFKHAIQDITNSAIGNRLTMMVQKQRVILTL